MKSFIAYSFGFLGFLMQGGAVIGLPVYVFFFGGSGWWFLAFFPLGVAGMIPLLIMSSMLKDKENGSEAHEWKSQELSIYFRPQPKDQIWGALTAQKADTVQQGFIKAADRANLDKYTDTNSLPTEAISTICDVANEFGEQNDLNPSFIIMLAHQYVDADQMMRQLHKTRWVASMVSRSDFAPPPESYVKYIKSTYFSVGE